MTEPPKDSACLPTANKDDEAHIEEDQGVSSVADSGFAASKASDAPEGVLICSPFVDLQKLLPPNSFVVMPFDMLSDDPSFHDWIVKALSSLGHSNPSSVARSYRSDSDQELVLLTLWLEDRVIRVRHVENVQNNNRDLASRELLRNQFWSSIDNYLDELECPERFVKDQLLTSGSISNVKEQSHWRYHPRLRIRVVYWLIATALSEAYEDVKNHEMFCSSRNADSPVSPSTSEIVWNSKDFPSGFATGDDQVERILTILRMRFLLQLHDEQARLNSVVLDMQQLKQKVGKTKPMKSRRRR